MALENTYTRRLDRSGGKYKGPKSTILPFFGFQYRTSEKSYNQTVYVPDRDSITGESPMTGTHYDRYEIFARHGIASAEEREFANCDVGDIWQTTYVPISLKEFYEGYRRKNSGKSISMIKLFPIIDLIVCVIIIISAIVSGYASSFGAGLVFLPIASLWVAFCFGWIVDIATEGIRAKQDKKYSQKEAAKHPYDRLSPEELDAVRQEYFAYMVRYYGEKQGDALRRYAIKKGYDRR